MKIDLYTQKDRREELKNGMQYKITHRVTEGDEKRWERLVAWHSKNDL